MQNHKKFSDEKKEKTEDKKVLYLTQIKSTDKSKRNIAFPHRCLSFFVLLRSFLCTDTEYKYLAIVFLRQAALCRSTLRGYVGGVLVRVQKQREQPAEMGRHFSVRCDVMRVCVCVSMCVCVRVIDVRVCV